ncbi:MAG: hypothetical protein K2X02_02740 [Alphaproteobacteria bacterium]|nr:hypothetical protein [Alphaproteobacteria bacterium]
MTTLQKKISTLEKKRDKIAQDIDHLLQTRNQELLEALRHVPHPALDANILVGGLLHVCEQAIANPQLANQWRETGQKFRRKRTNPKAVQKVA